MQVEVDSDGLSLTSFVTGGEAIRKKFPCKSRADLEVSSFGLSADDGDAVGQNQ